MSFVADTRTGAVTINQDSRTVTGPDSFLLMEDGSYLLLEDGGKISVESANNPVIFTLDVRN